MVKVVTQVDNIDNIDSTKVARYRDAYDNRPGTTFALLLCVRRSLLPAVK